TLLDGDEVVSRAGGPALHVRLRRRVVGPHLEDLADRHAADRFPGLEDRHRTEQPYAIEDLMGDIKHNSPKILTLTAGVMQVLIVPRQPHPLAPPWLRGGCGRERPGDRPLGVPAGG